MKRWGSALVFACLLASPAWAQKYAGDITLSLQPGLGVAVGRFSNDYTVAVEAGAQVDFAVQDGTAVGLRASYRMFNTTDDSPKAQAKITQIGVHGKRLFNPDNRLGMYGTLGGGVYWAKERGPELSEPEFGGYGGLGLHYESSDRLAFFVETLYNVYLTDPSPTGFFSLSVGLSIGLREE